MQIQEVDPELFFEAVLEEVIKGAKTSMPKTDGNHW